MVRALVILSLFAASAASAFSVLQCKKVISDEIYLSTKSNKLSVKWVTRGGTGETKLLRALADEAIPTSLLKAYGHLEITLSIPASSCEFSDNAGHFSCEHATNAGIAVTVKAKTSPYDFDVKPDLYKGKLSAFALESKFYGKEDSRYLKFPMRFQVASPKSADVRAETDFFFAHYWDYDGFNQDPSCLVDNVLLVD